MQITSVRYRKLVSLRGCERKALEAESPPSGPASRRKRLLLLIVAAVCAFERELTDLLPRLSLRYRKCLRRKLLPSLSNDLAFVFRWVGVFFCKGEMPVVMLQYCNAPLLRLSSIGGCVPP